MAVNIKDLPAATTISDKSKILYANPNGTGGTITASDFKKQVTKDIAGGLNFKGSCLYSSLPSAEKNDYYYCSDGNGTDGPGYYIWNGTKWDFLYNFNNSIDNTLSVEGAAADAKKTGDRINELKEDLVNISTNNGAIEVVKSTSNFNEVETSNNNEQGWLIIPNSDMFKKGTIIKEIKCGTKTYGNLIMCLISANGTVLEKYTYLINSYKENKIRVNIVLSDDCYIGFTSDVNGVFSLKPDYNGKPYRNAEIPNGVNVGDTLTLKYFDETKLSMWVEVSEYIIVHELQRKEDSLCNGKKFACFGDSITSNQVSGIGTMISNKLDTDLIGNFAVGYATCTDWYDSNNQNITTVTLTEPQNTNTNDNVLSNQIRRMLQHTTASGSQIKWTHPIDGEFLLQTSVGTGLGHINDIPDIIYIAISTNDGNKAENMFVDDCDMVFNQTYSQLTRTSIASSLRWAIETLQSAYPNALIYVASPLQCGNDLTQFSWSAGNTKREIIQKVCKYCSVNFIDSFAESGFSRMIAKTNGESGSTVHPNNYWKNRIAEYVANRISNYFYPTT